MLRVALTGNIASGKTEVARLLARHGLPVIDADMLAREVVERGQPAYDDIVARWGRSMLLPDESLDRAALRRIVFNDAGEREALNRIVHPRVQSRRDELLAEAGRRGDPIVISDIPLLFERGLEREFDRIILVDAPEPMRRARLVRERGLTETEAQAMIAAQMPAEQKRPHAHHIIENDGSREALAARVEEVLADLKKAAG